MEDAVRFEVHVPGGVIAGTRVGTGPTLVLLHGGPGLSDYLDSLQDELTPGYTVIRYQQRGVPPSTTEGPFSVEVHVDDALAIVRRVAPHGAVIVGHSWGGYLALHLAITDPEAVRGLVIVDPLGAVGDGGAADMSKLVQDRLTPEAKGRLAELDEEEREGRGTPEDAVESLRLTWPTRFADPSTAPAMPPMAISVECNSDTWTSIVDHLTNQTVAHLLSTVAVPTVFVLGAESPIPPKHGQATAALMPNAKVEIHDGCGHFPWIERPGVVRTAVDSLHHQ